MTTEESNDLGQRHLVAYHLRHTKETGLKGRRTTRHKGGMGTSQQGVSLVEDNLHFAPARKPIIIYRLDARGPCDDDMIVLLESLHGLEHRRQIVLDLLFPRACQKRDQLFTFHFSLFISQELAHFVSRRIPHIMDGIMMLLLEEIDLEGEDREELIDIATDVLDAVFLPCPDLWRDIIVDGDICPRFYIFSNLQIKARIIHEDHTVRLPCRDILLTHLHIAEYRWQVQQYWDKAHIGELLVVAHTGASNGCHQVAAEESEVCLSVNIFQGSHQVRCVQVARGFANDEIIFHL